MNFERRQIKGLQISNRLNANLFEPDLSDLTNARNAANRESRQEGVEVFGLNNEEAIRLAPVRSNFCKKLVGRNARGGSQRKLFANLLTNR